MVRTKHPRPSKPRKTPIKLRGIPPHLLLNGQRWGNPTIEKGPSSIGQNVKNPRTRRTRCTRKPSGIQVSMIGTASKGTPEGSTSESYTATPATVTSAYRTPQPSSPHSAASSPNFYLASGHWQECNYHDEVPNLAQPAPTTEASIWHVHRQSQSSPPPSPSSVEFPVPLSRFRETENPEFSIQPHFSHPGDVPYAMRERPGPSSTTSSPSFHSAGLPELGNSILSPPIGADGYSGYPDDDLATVMREVDALLLNDPSPENNNNPTYDYQ